MIDYKEVFRLSSDMISVHTAEGKYLDISDSCRHILGYDREEMIGKSAYDFFHPRDYEIISQSHEMILEQKGEPQVIYRIRKKDGGYIWYETTSKFIENDRYPDGIIYAYSRNATGRVAMELIDWKKVRQPDNLSEYLNMCAWSKKMKYKNEWLSFDGYLQKRFGINVSHGIADDAAQSFIKDYLKRKAEARI